MIFPRIIKFFHKNYNEEMYICLKNPNNDIKNLRNHKEIVTPNIIKVIYNYPLSRKFVFEHISKNKNGFSKKELIKVISKQYNIIYKEEKNTSIIKPGYISYNRNITNGKYGIWGHDLEDLDLHTIYKSYDNVYELGIDS